MSVAENPPAAPPFTGMVLDRASSAHARIGRGTTVLRRALHAHHASSNAVVGLAHCCFPRRRGERSLRVKMDPGARGTRRRRAHRRPGACERTRRTTSPFRAKHKPAPRTYDSRWRAHAYAKPVACDSLSRFCVSSVAGARWASASASAPPRSSSLRSAQRRWTGALAQTMRRSVPTSAGVRLRNRSASITAGRPGSET